MKRWHAKMLEREERAELLDAVTRALTTGELTFGEALRFLRAEYLSMSRGSYAEMVGLSTGALAKLERDEGNPTVQTLNQAFQPFGYRVGLVPLTSGSQAAPLPAARYQELLTAVRHVLSLNPRGR